MSTTVSERVRANATSGAIIIASAHHLLSELSDVPEFTQPVENRVTLRQMAGPWSDALSPALYRKFDGRTDIEGWNPVMMPSFTLTGPNEATKGYIRKTDVARKGSLIIGLFAALAWIGTALGGVVLIHPL